MKASGEAEVTDSIVWVASFSRTSGWASAAVKSLCNRVMMVLGVPAGASTPYQAAVTGSA